MRAIEAKTFSGYGGLQQNPRAAAIGERQVPSSSDASVAPNERVSQGALRGTSQVDDDFDPAGLDRHHFKRHRPSGLDAYPAFSHACGHQAIGYVLRPRLGKNVIEFD